ncbi:KTSC domain-containing protein [Pseudogracilibacillus sp. SE30717A]|uniref:KTSC domain-containing protein n=1 Tax=Pseudogracilibacillus sp. SE30717A TaxID=3098293 RepID=UPI003FA78E35
MQYVSSSNLVAVGYDSSSQTLRIQFHNGTYDYYNVPARIYHGLMNASSKGSYHAQYIKDAYRYRRL